VFSGFGGDLRGARPAVEACVAIVTLPRMGYRNPQKILGKTGMLAGGRSLPVIWSFANDPAISLAAAKRSLSFTFAPPSTRLLQFSEFALSPHNRSARASTGPVAKARSRWACRKDRRNFAAPTAARRLLRGW
jgi:hypothetical protein